MNTREIAKEYRLSHWAEILRERSASGKSIREYCKSAKICENVYYYWQRKLREAACTELAARTQERPAENGVQSLVPNGWTMCESTDESVKKETIMIEIGKCRVIVGAEPDTELLEKVCRTLMSLC